jgi:diaminohydroxyphosphoribosylaminopyrimidine deaminase/5-amino-6-(5-phosphoribosylamino)uracil reductase
MKRVFDLAKNGLGYTSPNPLVGAVIVKDGRVIGEGFHPRYGEKHAEIIAIEHAVEPVSGATLYCNLEPCCHNTPAKKTPPCTRRLIDEHIGRVYISTLDPNPHVCGKGIAALQEAGIGVKSGLLAEEAIKLNETYFKYIQTGLPFVHLKMALSLDGRIATFQNDSKWITDETARQMVHQMRHQYDAVMVGLNTVKQDNPRLTVRLPDGKQPFRIVLDGKLAIPRNSHVLQDEHREKTIIFTTPDHDRQTRRFIEYLGARVEVVEASSGGKIKLNTMLQRLANLGITSLLVEGGGRVFTEFIAQKLFDKVSLFYAPLFIGKGIEAVGDLGVAQIASAMRLENVSHTIINDQVLIQGYRNWQEAFGKLQFKTADSTCLPVSSKI